VTRYREDVAKVALVNPDDLAMLEQAHELVDALGALERARAHARRPSNYRRPTS